MYRDHEHVITAIQDKGQAYLMLCSQKYLTPNFTTKSSGTGLGLAICKGISEKANGTIWLKRWKVRDLPFLFPFLSLEAAFYRA